ncbi:PEPxxWA-CTERM sorting domain-containing protein [Altererythrobacter aurantiacus]|uniref:PEPxxWA-CTERM sorting domain-containing protein n=1 Tax=Parapontixanthobacter aurantiacus TaxID=1463599 RepID=A0A844ZGJ3_9SPHN|nr:PEPxxWA-CTERM sorting domain-containing protein [Parapontixanthobacter aurantiacus]MXO86493.1 PEPxxWA-CTERM sorting domain-containing protein [Parapontixanthobacter aurantiacus]
MKKLIVLLIGFAGLFAFPVSASAAELLFEFVGKNEQDSFSFVLDPDLGPDKIKGNTFTFKKVDVVTNTGTKAQTVNFYATATGTVLDFNQAHKFALETTNLFTGTIADPVFFTGTYTMRKTFNGVALGTMNVSKVASSVPEPATWAMILVGFAGLGGMMRRRPAKEDRRFRPYRHCQDFKA